MTSSTKPPSSKLFVTRRIFEEVEGSGRVGGFHSRADARIVCRQPPMRFYRRVFRQTIRRRLDYGTADGDRFLPLLEDSPSDEKLARKAAWSMMSFKSPDGDGLRWPLPIDLDFLGWLLRWCSLRDLAVHVLPAKFHVLLDHRELLRGVKLLNFTQGTVTSPSVSLLNFADPPVKALEVSDQLFPICKIQARPARGSAWPAACRSMEQAK